MNMPDGKSSQQVIDGLQKKLEFLGAQKICSWTLDCETFQSAHASGKQVFIFHFPLLENALVIYD